MKNYSRNLFLWVFLALVVMLAFTMVGPDMGGKQEEVNFSTVVHSAKQHQIKEVTIKGQEIFGTLSDGTSFKTVGPTESDYFLGVLDDNDIVPNYEPQPNGGLITVLTTALPMVLFLVLFLLIMRQLQVGGGKAMSFGKSKAKLLSDDGRKVTFEDVAGADEAKEELIEIIEFLKDPRKYTRLGGRIPKGVLLMGPPGTGKTLLARAIAGEAGVPFFSISGSDFVEMFVGVGASRVRDLFEQGKKHAPCIIFIDEIDAVGRQRGAGMGGGHDEREQTLNQLLVEMDGFESNDGVILVAATNRPDVLDPALMRPGRFDRRIVVGNPDVKGRLGILEVHTRRTPLADGVQLEVIARGTPGFSGADLENLVNEAALLAARREKDKLEMIDFEDAKDKVAMGVERKSMVIPERVRRRTAYHEAGHAIIAHLIPASDPVHKITIIPRGRALGMTVMLPDEDRLEATTDQLTARLAVAMGGRAAEEIIFKEITTGAHNDIKQATELARAMVTQYGMSEAIGPMNLSGQGEVFLGRDYSKVQAHSEDTSRLIDREVRRLLEDAYTLASKILNENNHILERVSELLLDKETLGSKEFGALVASLNPVEPNLQGA
ncbi:MAG: cell division protease FtsH [Myxococcota bacterium]|jgi:cell division protease FtsH